MSLGRILRDLAKSELGMFSAHERNFYYVFCDESTIGKFHKKLHRHLKAPHWTEEKIKERFPIKFDDNGKGYIVQYAYSMPCVLESVASKYPVRDKHVLVPKYECKKCEHRKMWRNKYYCQALRNKNKGLFMDTVSGAFKKANEIMGK